MIYITEPSKSVPVIMEADICVLGGSCTGVFAAVRASRLGAKVVLVEKQNSFGGVATSGFVTIWHSLHDTSYTEQIIGGLTHETIERLKRRNGVVFKPNNCSTAYTLNTEELKIELDELVKEANVEPMLHCWYAGPYTMDGNLKGVFVERKGGRGVILARVFIDATGDGDLCTHLGIENTVPAEKQPPSPGAKMVGMDKLEEGVLRKLIYQHGEEFGLKKDWGWGSKVPGAPGVTFHVESHVFGVNCADADDLTYSEMEGRRQVRAIMDILRKYSPETPVGLAALCSYIGIRETRHVHCSYKLTEEDVITGRRFSDAIANGTYPVDIHHDDKPGLTFKYLDGTQKYCRDGFPDEITRWRPELPEDPKFYQIPYRCLIPAGGRDNLLAAGRMIDADKGAYGAIRVMVNLNQTGEAAGAAAYLALENGQPVNKIDTRELRSTLEQGGSIIF